MSRVRIFIFVALMLFGISDAVFAAGGTTIGYVDWAKVIFISVSIFSAALCMAIGTIGTGLGMGRATASASDAVGRNPDAHGKIMLTLMVGLAMTESIAIYALVVVLIILYANPFKAVILG